ncbi:MAG: sensor histidine kinase [Isosphaeraceae bacterium]
MNILVADDDSVSRRLLQSHLQKWAWCRGTRDPARNSRRLLQSHLQKWGYHVTAAQDGAEAWQLFQAGLFPMVITDWMMPELDGPGLVRHIRSSERPGYVFTILLTAKSEKRDFVEGMESGADDFLTKPFDRDELRAGERIIRLEQHVRETQAALIQNEQLASLGRLAAGLAHEINNPISYVINNLAVIRRDVQPALKLLEEYRDEREALSLVEPARAARLAQLEEEMDLPYLQENLGRMFDSAANGLRRIHGIVRNLRDFVRLDEAASKEVNLNEALRSTLETLHYELGQKPVRLQTGFQELPPLECHPAKINQVFLNILLNAIQASSADGIIELRTRTDGEKAVVIEIEDHGTGISPENLPHLFDPFFTTKPVGGGMGLGLTVSYGIVRDHGGSLEVESVLGQGSVFRIRLPLHPLGSHRRQGSG